MPERGWEDLPEHGDAPNRFDVDGLGARLFGGPSATLYGDPGIPSQTDWDSKEIPSVLTGAAVEAHGSTGTNGGGGEVEYAGAAETGSMVRPYTKTGGRTRSDYDLAIEALVSTSERGR